MNLRAFIRALPLENRDCLADRLGSGWRLKPYLWRTPGQHCGCLIGLAVRDYSPIEFGELTDTLRHRLKVANVLDWLDALIVETPSVEFEVLRLLKEVGRDA